MPRSVFLTECVPAGISVGFFDKVREIHKFGRNGDVGATLETLWNEGGIYAYPASAITMQVSSSDVNDDAGDAGALTVEIQGLDGDYAEQTETVTLNGQSQVATSNTYLRVFRMRVVTAGASGWNEGTIYCGTGGPTAGKPDVVYGLIEPFQNQTLMALYTVPAGYRGVILQTIMTSAVAKAVEGGIYIRPLGGVFNIKEYVSLISGAVILPHTAAELVDEKSDLEMRALAAGAGGNVSGQFEIILMEKK